VIDRDIAWQGMLKGKSIMEDQFDRFIDAMLTAPGMMDMAEELNFLCEQLKDVPAKDQLLFYDRIQTTNIYANASPEEILSIIKKVMETIGDYQEKKEKIISEAIRSWESADKPALFHFQIDEKSYIIIKNWDGSYSLVFLEDDGYPLREIKPGDPLRLPLQ
jgi:hypothetical protein